MENSVIISSICPRIEYYASAAGITSEVEKKEYKKKLKKLEENITHPQLLDIKRNLETFNLAMGEKRTTEKMYLERDIKYLEDIENQIFPVDKNRGRNFVVTMKQNAEVFEQEQTSSEKGQGRSFIKVNPNSNAYKVYSDAA